MSVQPLIYQKNIAATPRELPAEFSDLMPWVADWALRHERERNRKLLSVEIDELRPFYDAMLSRLPEIKRYLDQFPLNAMPAEASTLFDLAMTFVETAHPIDLGWKSTDIEDKFPIERFLIKSAF